MFSPYDYIRGSSSVPDSDSTLIQRPGCALPDDGPKHPVMILEVL